MHDKTIGEYKRTTPDPDETTGEALARLQATMARLLDEADAELRDEADGGVAAALIEKEAEENDAAEAHPLTAREHLDAAWDAAHVPADGIIPEGRMFLDRGTAGVVVVGAAGKDLASRGSSWERRLVDPPTPARPEGAEGIDEHLRQANAAALGGALTPEQRRALADHLAGFGYRNPIDRAEDPR